MTLEEFKEYKNRPKCFYTKEEIQLILNDISQKVVVDTLPAEGLENYLYLVPSIVNPGTYEQYTWKNNNWEHLGNVDEALYTDYVTNPELDNTIERISLVTSAALNDLDDRKQDTLVSGQNIKSINGQSVLGAGNMTIHEEQLIEKSYAPAEFSGLGRKYLQKNIVSDKNVLTQAMMQDANTIYVIQYDYDLNGETITLPSGCTIKFEGGSINNGQLNTNGAFIDGTFNGTCVLSSPFKELSKVPLISDPLHYKKLSGNIYEGTHVNIENDDDVVYTVSQYSLIENFTLTNDYRGNSKYGIAFTTAGTSAPQENIWRNLEISYFKKGIELYGNGYHTISDVRFFRNKYGLYIDSSNWIGGIKIENCHFVGNDYAIYINATQASPIYINNCIFEGNLHDIKVIGFGEVYVNSCYFGDQSRNSDKDTKIEVISVGQKTRIYFNNCSLQSGAGDNRASGGVLFDLQGSDNDPCKVYVTNSYIHLGSQFSSDNYLFNSLSRNNLISFNNVINVKSILNYQHSWNLPMLINEVVPELDFNNDVNNYVVNGYFDDLEQNAILNAVSNVTILNDLNLYGGHLLKMTKYSFDMYYHVPDKYIGKEMILEIATYKISNANAPRINRTYSDLDISNDLPIEPVTGKPGIRQYNVIPTKSIGRFQCTVNDLQSGTLGEVTIGYFRLLPKEYASMCDYYPSVNDILFMPKAEEFGNLPLKASRDVWGCQGGITQLIKPYSSYTGTTANRPIPHYAGFTYWDTDLGKMIAWNGSAWVNLDGTALA